jgi:hypothetical protein
MLLHRDVLIERSGRIQFGGVLVVQSWNISLGHELNNELLFTEHMIIMI